MKIKVKYEDNTINDAIFDGSTVNELLKYLALNPETVLVIKDNEVLTEDDSLEDNDTIEILNVVSGG